MNMLIFNLTYVFQNTETLIWNSITYTVYWHWAQRTVTCYSTTDLFLVGLCGTPQRRDQGGNDIAFPLSSSVVSFRMNATAQGWLQCLQQYLLKGWLLSNLYLALAGKALKLMTLETRSTFYGCSKHLLCQYLLMKKTRKDPQSLFIWMPNSLIL